MCMHTHTHTHTWQHNNTQTACLCEAINICNYMSVFVSDTLKVWMWKHGLSVTSPRPYRPHQTTHLPPVRRACPPSGWRREPVTMAAWLMHCGHCETWCSRTPWPLPEQFLLKTFSQVTRCFSTLLRRGRKCHFLLGGGGGVDKYSPVNLEGLLRESKFTKVGGGGGGGSSQPWGTSESKI